MIEEEFKNILTQDMNSGFGTFEAREEEQEEEEGIFAWDVDDDGDDMEDYTDEIQMPGEEEI